MIRFYLKRVLRMFPMFVLFFEDTLTLEYINMETIREQRAQSSTVKTPKG